MDVVHPTIKYITEVIQRGNSSGQFLEITENWRELNVTTKDLIHLFSSSPIAPTVGDFIHEEAAMCNLTDFYKGYRNVHGWLSLCVCIFGTIANILNIVVLTRKEMNGSPINLILTGIAVADMLVMIEYIPFSLHRILLTGRSKELEFSWGFSLFVWSHSNFSLVIHAVSIWLTLSLAVWRFIMIRFHTLSPVYCTLGRCKILLFLAYVIPVFLCIPNYISTTINKKTNQGKVIYVLDWSEIATAHNKLLYRINIWLYTFLLKLIPCIVLTIITGWLIRALYKAEERSARLRNRHSETNNKNTKIRNGNANGVTPVTSRKKSADRTTRLLIVILILFLLTEFPQGILGMLSAIYGDQFFKDCYRPLGDVMDAMALINSAINFILYCFMSKQFRKTFVDTFGCKNTPSGTSVCVAKENDAPQNDRPSKRRRQASPMPSRRRSALRMRKNQMPEEIPMILTKNDGDSHKEETHLQRDSKNEEFEPKA